MLGGLAAAGFAAAAGFTAVGFSAAAGFVAASGFSGEAEGLADGLAAAAGRVEAAGFREGSASRCSGIRCPLGACADVPRPRPVPLGTVDDPPPSSVHSPPSGFPLGTRGWLGSYFRALANVTRARRTGASIRSAAVTLRRSSVCFAIISSVNGPVTCSVR